MTVLPPAEIEPADSSQAARLEQAQQFFMQLKKSFKTISLYRHNTAGYLGFLKNAYDVLRDFLEHYESLPLQVEQFAFRTGGGTAYDEEANEQNLAFKFYRDGVRLITLRRGLDERELLDFVLICLGQVHDLQGEDMVSLLWKKDFKHIEHVVMESFVLGQGVAGEQAQIEVDKIVNYLYRGLTTHTDDSHQYARLALDDLDIEIDEVERVAGLSVRGQVADEELRQVVRADLKRDDEVRLTPRLGDILLTTLRVELDEKRARALEQALLLLLDGLLLRGLLAELERLLGMIERASEQPLPPSSQVLTHHLLQSLTAALAQPERIDRLGDLLENRSDPESLAQVRTYLGRVIGLAVGPCLDLLERLNRPDARSLLVELLAGLGPEHLPLFVERLQRPKANLVRDMLAVIDRLDPPDKLKLLAGLLQHPNLALRMEALTTIGKRGDNAAGPYVMKALRDPDPQVRTTAIRLVPNFEPTVAKRTLLALAQAPDFSERPVQEQAAVHTSLAMTGAPEALDYFRAQLRAGSMLHRKQAQEIKRALVTAMAASGSIAIYRLLAEELKSGVKDPELAQMIERTCARMKERLLGG